VHNVDKDIPVLIKADETTQLKKLAFVMDADTDMLRLAFGDDSASYAKPAKWAEAAAPFILTLGPKHNGQSLSVSQFEA
jgi:hypothetical protein